MYSEHFIQDYYIQQYLEYQIHSGIIMVIGPIHFHNVKVFSYPFYIYLFMLRIHLYLFIFVFIYLSETSIYRFRISRFPGVIV
jgi:hypothetical protein